MRIQYVKIEDEKKVPHLVKYKLLVFLIIATITVFFLFINKYDVRLKFHEFSPHGNLIYSDVFNEKEYFIKTDGCKMPGFEPFSNSVIQFYHKEKPILCHTKDNPPLVESDENSIWIVEKYFMNYNINLDSNFSCCYTSFYRQPANESSLDNRSKYVNECIHFSGKKIISDEFIRVTCFKNNITIYKDFFSFVIKDNRNSINVTNSNKYSVLMLGIDAVSRLNFHRTMPKTVKTLKRMNAIEMFGYNKVGDNTYPNLVPVLTGMSSDEIEDACYKEKTFDNCHFIWDDYKEKGYYTAFVEDASPIGLFNYRKNGFSETPTDFYWRTFNRQAILEIGHEDRLNCHLCLGPRLSLDVLLSYTMKLAVTMASNLYFGFVWETSLTHDVLNYPILGDQKYADLIENMEKQGLLNSTILILLSDHGIRWGKIRSTHQGQIEERLPLLFFVLPESFKSKYSLATNNLKVNSRRLTTPYDLHETLLDLLNVETLLNKRLRNRIAKTSYMKNRGISLVFPVIGNRTCQSASINPHWCTCHQSRDIQTNSSIASQVAKIVVDYINTLLVEYIQCAKLTLSRIINLSVGEPTYLEKIMVDIDHIVTDYTIQLETTPGNGLFEATVRNSVNGWNVTGTISRINLYGKQSYCVNDFHLKLYCYCDSFIPKINLF